MLSKLTDWVSKLVNVEYALNNTMHATTRKSPSLLLFGVEQRGRIIDELTEFFEDKTISKACDLDKIRLEASENIEKTQKYSQLYFLRHSIPAKVFNLGNFVVMENIGIPVQIESCSKNIKGLMILRKSYHMIDMLLQISDIIRLPKYHMMVWLNQGDFVCG